MHEHNAQWKLPNLQFEALTHLIMKQIIKADEPCMQSSAEITAEMRAVCAKIISHTLVYRR